VYNGATHALPARDRKEEGQAGDCTRREGAADCGKEGRRGEEKKIGGQHRKVREKRRKGGEKKGEQKKKEGLDRLYYWWMTSTSP
jgi:hypothetical protein